MSFQDRTKSNCSVVRPSSPDSCKQKPMFSIKMPLYDCGKLYSKHDDPVILGSSGIESQTYVWSLTDEPNSDLPIQGIARNPPTWKARTLSSIIKGE